MKPTPTDLSTGGGSQETGVPPSLTIFSMPKAFRGHIGVIQRNAILSWTRLAPRPDVILFGDDEGTAEFASEHNLRHVSDVERNEYGTPLINGMFRQAAELAAGDVLAYVNADIVLLSDFMAAIDIVTAADFERFLMIGRRTDMNVFSPLDFESQSWETDLRRKARESGELVARVCKDYFVYRRPLYEDIPPLLIGRCVWDNWLVYHAHQEGVPVIDASAAVAVVHQNHDYAHLKKGEREAYGQGEEKARNRELAGGEHLWAGMAATWNLTARGGLRRKRVASHLLQFFADLPRFSLLIMRLNGWRRSFPSPPSGPAGDSGGDGEDAGTDATRSEEVVSR